MKTITIVFFLLLSTCAFGQMNVSIYGAAATPTVVIPPLQPAQTLTITTGVNSFGAEGIQKIDLGSQYQAVSAPQVHDGRITQRFAVTANGAQSQTSHMSVTDVNGEVHSVVAVAMSPGGGDSVEEHHDDDGDSDSSSTTAPTDSIGLQIDRQNGQAGQDSIHIQIDGGSKGNSASSSKWWWLVFAGLGFVVGKQMGKKR
jgi:hypothetical protein